MTYNGDHIPPIKGAGTARKGRKFPDSAKRYGFGSLKVGQSITGPHKIATAARKFSREHAGYKFTSRKIDAELTQVWRIE